MTRDRAREILDIARAGGAVARWQITQALSATGDLSHRPPPKSVPVAQPSDGLRIVPHAIRNQPRLAAVWGRVVAA